MSDFKAKMHQIRFRLGLRPDPTGGDPLAGFKGHPSKGRGGRGGGRGGKDRGREGEKWEGRSLGPRSGPLTFCGSTPMLTVTVLVIETFNLLVLLVIQLLPYGTV